jgi:bacterioferritin
MKTDQPFLTDVKQLREQARASIDRGAVTPTYQGDVKQTIDILQSVLATEIVCVLRYTMNAIAATGISSEGEGGIRRARQRGGGACQSGGRAHQSA